MVVSVAKILYGACAVPDIRSDLILVSALNASVGSNVMTLPVLKPLSVNANDNDPVLLFFTVNDIATCGKSCRARPDANEDVTQGRPGIEYAGT